MDVRHDLSELAYGLGFQVVLDGTRPLPELTAALTGICEQAEDRPAAPVVVLRLDGVAVRDRAWPGAVGIQEVSRWERAVRRVERLPAVSIAVAGHACGGPTLDLLLAADYRIAAPDMRLLLPITDDHCWPGMALHRLVGQVGLARARQIVLWGTELPAAQAVRLGLVDETAADVTAAIQDAAVWLGRIAGPELAVRRQLLQEATVTSYEDALGLHLAACDRELRRVSGRPEPGRPESGRPESGRPESGRPEPGRPDPAAPGAVGSGTAASDR